MYGGSSDGDSHKAATQRKIPPASSMLWAPETSSVHRNRCRTWIRSSNEYVSRLSDLHCLITLPQFYPFYNFHQYIQSFSISLKIDSHRKWIEGGDYGLCIEDVRDEIWDMVKPVDLH
ncbi:hypothetical protein Goshw_001600 [Gossypium schwendimanii]|uniref:Uncharacterized protein n=1 Tax=Gossypium schwendimanii TaxID=34291 RepID=A0A7J9LDE1_GOSSC|nr:hypothetical protein [Gossypium schwendimanii]